MCAILKNAIVPKLVEKRRKVCEPIDLPFPFPRRRGENLPGRALCAVDCRRNQQRLQFYQTAKKEVARLDTLSAQVAEMQVLMNMIVNKM